MSHNDILAKLKDAIRSVSDKIQSYVSNPGDFSRNGKLPADVLMEFLIGQGSRSTRNELIDAFSFYKVPDVSRCCHLKLHIASFFSFFSRFSYCRDLDLLQALAVIERTVADGG